MSMYRVSAAVARAVRAHMTRAGLTQHQMAEHLGIAQQAVSRRLTGEVAFTIDQVVAIAELLSVPLDQLIHGEPRRNRGVRKTSDASAHQPASGADAFRPPRRGPSKTEGSPGRRGQAGPMNISVRGCTTKNA